MVASRQVHVLRVQHLESHHCQYDLKGKGASVHKIACKNSDVMRHPRLNLLHLDNSLHTLTPGRNLSGCRICIMALTEHSLILTGL